MRFLEYHSSQLGTEGLSAAGQTCPIPPSTFRSTPVM
jgi:hypothetical protein